MASKHDILSVLQDVQSGALTPEDALLHLKLAPFEDLGYAKVDYRSEEHTSELQSQR